MDAFKVPGENPHMPASSVLAQSALAKMAKHATDMIFHAMGQ
jgi:hypothetical protein